MNGEDTCRNRELVIQKDNENIMGGTCKQQRNFKGNRKKSNVYWVQK